jgi:hypothetical protein
VKPFISLTLLFIVSSASHGQKVLTKTGMAPPIPSEGKWVVEKKRPRLEDMRGSVVVVHFWVEGSDTCKNNFAVLAEWKAKYGPGGGFNVIGIHGRPIEDNPTKEDIEKTAKKMRNIFPTLIEDTEQTMKAWNVDQVPTLYVIDKKGRLRYSWEGQLNFRRLNGGDMVAAKIVELMQEK